jgi:hypothetical protein
MGRAFVVASIVILYGGLGTALVGHFLVRLICEIIQREEEEP